MYTAIRAINKFFKSGMYDYCNIETNDTNDSTESSLVNKDGGMTTVLRIDGSRKLVGARRFRETILELMDSLSGTLKKPGYKIDFCFTSDPYSSDRKVNNSLKSAYGTIKRLNLNIEDLLHERGKVLADNTIAENCYMVLTSLPGVLNSKNFNEEMKERLELIKPFKIGVKPGEYGQSPFTAINGIRDAHTGFVNAVEESFGKSVAFKRLNVHEALRAIKLEINMDATSDDWRPSMLGDRIRPRALMESKNSFDTSHTMNPNVAFQLFNQRPEIHKDDSSLVKMGNTVIAPLFVDIPPQSPKPFTELMDKIDKEIPWRFSFTMETGHDSVLSKVMSKNSFATSLAMFSSGNRLIRDAAEELIGLAREGEPLVMGSMSFCTWGPDVKTANKRKQTLMQQASNWGSMEIIEEFGDPITTWMDGIPGMTKRKSSTPFPMCMTDAFTIMPITSPASPWEQGSLLFRTISKKLYPYEPSSTKQSAWFDITFAPPGMGKSFFLAAANMALITAAGNLILPRISIIDIGYSSAAFVNLVKSSLPKDKKHLAQAYKLEMTSKYTINMFDTPLGCQFPTSLDKESLVSFMTDLLTPAGAGPISRLPEITGSLVNEMYEYFSEDKSPKLYEHGVSSDTDKALESIDFELEPDEEISWYKISKALFDKGLYQDAVKAQRYAVPNISDATTILSTSSNIKDIFADASVGLENTLKLIESMLTSVTTDYPILSGPSQFDIGEARICSIDLQNVTKGNSVQAKKRTGLMYMLARQVMCRTFYLDKDVLDEIPRHFRKYHAKIIEADENVVKKLCMDEFHRTRFSPGVRLQALQDIREGRKFNVSVSLLSQIVDDFDTDMIEVVNNVYILSKGNSEDTIRKIKEKFNPSDDAIRQLRRYCTGPGREGSAMLYLGEQKGGESLEMILRLTLGPIERWAYSTTKEDVNLRERLSSSIGLNNTLKILSLEFPGGTAKDYLKSLGLDEDADEPDFNVYDNVKKELIIKHKGEINSDYSLAA